MNSLSGKLNNMPKEFKTLTQQCIESLRSDIFNAVFKPGEQLKMVLLKERYQMGTSPIREALFLLVQMGIVEIEENKGFKVKLYSRKELIDNQQVLMGIESWALDLAIEKGDAQWEAEILSSLHQLKVVETQSKSASYKEWVPVNYRFHSALISACDSLMLMKIREKLYYNIDWLCYFYFEILKAPLLHHHEDHAAIAQAAIARKKKLAIELLQKHFGNLEEKVIPALEKQGYMKIDK